MQTGPHCDKLAAIYSVIGGIGGDGCLWKDVVRRSTSGASGARIVRRTE